MNAPILRCVEEGEGFALFVNDARVGTLRARVQREDTSSTDLTPGPSPKGEGSRSLNAKYIGIDASVPEGDILLNARLSGVEFPLPFREGGQGVRSVSEGESLRYDYQLSQPYPNAIFVQCTVTNTGSESISLDAFDAPCLEYTPSERAEGGEGTVGTTENDQALPEKAYSSLQHFPSPRPPDYVGIFDSPREAGRGSLWSFQGAAVAWGQDFAFPLPDEFSRDNYLGHIDNGEGGGVPLSGVWTPDFGLALAHVEPQPWNGYLPVARDQTGVRLALSDRRARTLAPGQRWSGPRAVVIAHHGDFFDPLALYAQIMAAQGLRPAAPSPEDFEPAWCSWGYEEDVLPEEIIAALPAVRALGIRWVTLDDRWFDHYGDHNPRADTFPGGDAQMRALVDEIHRAGAYAQIWWYPLAVEDAQGSYGRLTYATSQVLQAHPDWLIRNPDGSPGRNNRGLPMLCPALPAVQEFLRETNRRFIEDWDFDGHKLDNIYTVPPCYNPAHQHASPDESTAALAEVYRIIFEETRARKPHAVIQICPCGTPPTFSLLPWMTQSVTADPTSSAQIRQRIKFYKALLGPRAAVFADHVELSDGGVDFASEIGAGGVPGTKFVWPEAEAVRARLEEYWPLDETKRALLERWLALYRQLRLAEGEYLNLYDLAFDAPEAHAIRQHGKMYYAFFATPPPDRPEGGVEGPLIELRGLPPGRYEVRDVLAGAVIAQATAAEDGTIQLHIPFTGALLLEAILLTLMEG